jgi:hypothetical protein
MERNAKIRFNSSPISLTFSTELVNTLRMDIGDDCEFFFELDEVIAVLG